METQILSSVEWTCFSWSRLHGPKMLKGPTTRHSQGLGTHIGLIIPSFCFFFLFFILFSFYFMSTTPKSPSPLRNHFNTLPSRLSSHNVLQIPQQPTPLSRLPIPRSQSTSSLHDLVSDLKQQQQQRRKRENWRHLKTLFHGMHQLSFVIIIRPRADRRH
ncbi:hypothetical protein BJV82DRAFT_137231 [Fennellomyces sp. T-0311]|nr:hypothetical protein BJV82DRAFT_137231 [Fennellomyces sp. T-0311]